MTTPGWAILSAVIYLVLIFTLALMTFRKGHWVLGIIGFIFPLLWLIGAIMPTPAALPLTAPRVVPRIAESPRPSRRRPARIPSPAAVSPVRPALGTQELGLGGGEFLVGQDALLVQRRQLVQLVDHGRWRRGRRRRRFRRRRRLLV